MVAADPMHFTLFVENLQTGCRDLNGVTFLRLSQKHTLQVKALEGIMQQFQQS